MSGTDPFWKSNTTRNAVGWFVGAVMTAVLTAFAWTVAETAEVRGDIKVIKQRDIDVREDIRDIKSDLKTLLERIK